MSRKLRDLTVIALIYLLAYAAGAAACFAIGERLWRFFVFDLVATVVTFIFSALLHNSSVYDAYWSLTPLVMAVWLFIEARAFSVWQLLFLGAFSLWAVRLTGNWIAVFTDFTYEDWRYRKYRAENPPALFFVINFCGIHMVPTLVVFAGMLPLFDIVRSPLGALSLPGVGVILCGVALEFFADRQMHAHLAGGTVGATCQAGLWKYSRHPNYLGEITVWLGTFLTALPYFPERWYTVVGFLAVALLFNIVSIPLAEKRQLSRRADYADYRARTSRLLLLPPKNN